MNIYTILFYILAACSAALPVPFTKKYSETENPLWLILSVMSYLVLIYVYLIILKTGNLFIAYPIIKIVSIIIVVLSGYFYFNTKITFNRLLGLLLGVVAIYLME
jgi:hypothetical protein